MAYAGHKCKVKISGSALTLTDAATSTTDDITFQITDAARRVLDPKADITVEVDPEADGTFVVADPSTYTLNRLNGSVTFDTAQTGANVIISGYYLPLLDVAEAYEFTYSLEGNNEAANRFQSEWQRREQTLKDITAELAAWHDVNVDVFYDALNTGNLMVLEFYVNDVLDLRAWCISASDEIASAADGLIEESLEFEGSTDKEGRVVSFE